MTSFNDSRVSGVAHFDVDITDRNLDTTVAMLISHIKKSWDVKKLHKKVYDSGITNQLLGYYVDDPNTKMSAKFGELGRSDIVLIRIYGAKTELIIDRAQELLNFHELAANDLAPPVYCTFNNGYCYKYIEGRVLNVDDMKNNSIKRQIASKMAALHSVKLSEHFLKNHKMESTLFNTIRRYISLIPKRFKLESKQKRFEEAIPAIEKLNEEIKMLEDVVLKMKHRQGITFCHNDLLIANFIYDEYQNEIHVIDHEYGCPNFPVYDIGNHFNEWAGVDTVDYTLFPDKQTQLEWLDIYLNEFKKLQGDHSKASETEIYNLYVQVNKFSLVSHFFWGVWGLIQAHYSEIEFDYLEYSVLRLNEYFKNKEAFLALTEIDN